MDVAVNCSALTLASLSGNRFVLGLGASGPQIVEGLHGQRFERPLRRMSETIDIVRRAFAGERLVYEGEVFRLPLPVTARRCDWPTHPTIGFPSIWPPSPPGRWP